jgi:hypothetical protein
MIFLDNGLVIDNPAIATRHAVIKTSCVAGGRSLCRARHCHCRRLIARILRGVGVRRASQTLPASCARYRVGGEAEEEFRPIGGALHVFFEFSVLLVVANTP